MKKFKNEKVKQIKINIGLKANLLPKNCLKEIGNNIDWRSAKRLFDAEEKFYSVNGKLNKFSERAFNDLYKTLDESEKKLYCIWSIEIFDNRNVKKIIKDLRNNKSVQFAETDQLNKLSYIPNDTRFEDLWGHEMINADSAWDISEGENVVVAVIDSGVNYNHPDIFNNMWQDVNGRFGFDFSDNDNDPMDTDGHGTHVAGTIAATGNNNIGIIGIAPRARIMAVKIFPNSYDSVIAKALKYAVDNGAKILNNSWGPIERRPSNPVVEVAINYVNERGGICVFAAGNDNDNVEHYSPANMGNVITVGAINEEEERSDFSNYGEIVNIAAPGVDILSLRHNNDGYRNNSGTSMAAPHVSGAIALLLSRNPDYGLNRILICLENGGDEIATDNPIGKRLNALNMLDINVRGNWFEPIISLLNS